ncbi:MAG: alanine dehydrogenase [Thermoleophilia bacterium]|nr:alanine dehydrogenase [Thermoleophilia bacterium]
MRVAVVREIKTDEHRVALTPDGAADLVAAGHEVLVERGAGAGSGFPDGAYAAAGAALVDVEDAWDRADLVVKVKEPLASEWPRLRPGQVLFTFLHLAPDPELTRALTESGATCIAYETVQTDDGRLPLLAPMSEVAGRLAPQVGAGALERSRGGRGVLLAGLPGVPPARVVVIGGGIVGTNAAAIALGMGAEVTVIERSVERLRQLELELGRRARLVVSTPAAVRRELGDADMVIGAVLVAGSRAPRLVSREDLSRMREGAVLVDVAIDQGGCFETSRPTTHRDPVFTVDGVVHYCVANMPGVVPLTSTLGLTAVTLPYVRLIADMGAEAAIRRSAPLRRGVSTMAGQLTSREVADASGARWAAVEDLLAA